MVCAPLEFNEDLDIILSASKRRKGGEERGREEARRIRKVISLSCSGRALMGTGSRLSPQEAAL